MRVGVIVVSLVFVCSVRGLEMRLFQGCPFSIVVAVLPFHEMDASRRRGYSAISGRHSRKGRKTGPRTAQSISRASRHGQPDLAHHSILLLTGGECRRNMPLPFRGRQHHDWREIPSIQGHLPRNQLVMPGSPRSRCPSRVIPPWNDSVTAWDDMSYESVIVNGRDESLRPGQGVVAHKGCEILVATAGWERSGHSGHGDQSRKSPSSQDASECPRPYWQAALTGIPRCHARESARHEAQFPALKNLVA